MKFELTNTERAYFGLKLVQNHWDKVQLTDEIYLYFEGNTIKKSVTVSDTHYMEKEIHAETKNREVLISETEKGKSEKLTLSSFQARNGMGTYFSYVQYKGVLIGNYTTQKTFYTTAIEEIKISTFKHLKKWVAKYIKESTAADLLAIKQFSEEKRKRVKIKEGDFFCFKIDRRNYGFGRVLLDIRKLKKESVFKKEKNYGLTNLKGQPLVIKIYHKISKSKTINLDALKNMAAFPSQYLMDDVLFYGEHEIIGNLPLENRELDFPISYSRSINAIDKNTVYMQWGLLYKEIDISKCNVFLATENLFPTDGNHRTTENPYKNEIISMELNLKKRILKQCIDSNSNYPFWEAQTSNSYRDLRNPRHQKEKEIIFKKMGLYRTLDYYHLNLEAQYLLPNEAV